MFGAFKLAGRDAKAIVILTTLGIDRKHANKYVCNGALPALRDARKIAMNKKLSPEETLCFISAVYINGHSNSKNLEWQSNMAKALEGHFEDKYLFGDMREDVYNEYRKALALKNN